MRIKRLAAAMIGSILLTTLPAQAEDYAFLEDMTIKELRELDAKIRTYLPEEKADDMAAETEIETENEIETEAGSETENAAVDDQELTEQAVKKEGEGYASSEEAFDAYVSAFAAKDYDGMCSTFSVETYVDHYKLEAQLERVMGWYINSHDVVPLKGDFSRAININMREKMIADTIRMQYLAVEFNHDSFEMGSSIHLQESDLPLTEKLFTDAFEKAQISVISQLSAEEAYEKYNDYEEQTIKNAAYFGADEVDNRAAVLDISGKQWVLTMETARYGDRWYMNRANGSLSILLGMDVNSGGLTPMEEVSSFNG